MIIALNSQPIRLKNNLKSFAAFSQKVRSNIIHCWEEYSAALNQYFPQCLNPGNIVTFSLRQLLKRTRENRTVSVNCHFNLREKHIENRVTLLSNHYGLP